MKCIPRWIPCASRAYIHLSAEVCRDDTTGSIAKKIGQWICENGTENIYRIELRGKRDPDVLLDTSRMAGEGNILEIADRTSPAYDFEKLYAEHKDSILGKYIGSSGNAGRTAWSTRRCAKVWKP